MTDEEKEAIEYLKYKIEDNRKMLREYEESGNAVGYGTMTDVYKGAICNFTILLNLIEKKDKIIESQKYIIQERDIEILDLKDSRCLVKRYFKLKDENKRKDKIIEKMAERVYLKKEEYECVRENQRNNIHKSFEDCIIEYFEKEEG